jgi:glycosyltransferase involved in cell wall biosynthesis
MTPPYDATAPARETPTISIIVATYNSASGTELVQCLDSIRAQTVAPLVELIVVDGGSTDGTLSQASSRADRILSNPARTELGFGGGKNLGLRHATGQLVAMVDADNRIVEPEYLERLAEPLLSSPNVVLAVPQPWVPPKGGAPSICRYFCLQERDAWNRWAADGELRSDWVEFRPPRGVVPNGGLLRRGDLLALGGWDYDTEVGARLLGTREHRFALVKSVHRFHDEMHNYSEVWRKLDRRMRTQSENMAAKAVVRDEIREGLRDPVAVLRAEIALPLSEALTRRESAYFHAIPVVILKTLLFIARRTWRTG